MWETCLGTVLNNLSEEHTAEFVKTVLLNGEMRKHFTHELLRTAKHVPDLADCDIVEFLSLPVHENDHNDHHQAWPEMRFCKVGDLPYWLNAALKAHFRDRSSSSAQRGCESSKVAIFNRPCATAACSAVAPDRVRALSSAAARRRACSASPPAATFG